MSTGRPLTVDGSSSISSEQLRARVLERRRDGQRSVRAATAAVGDKKPSHEVSIQTISLEDFVQHEKAIKDSYSVAWNSNHDPGKGLGLQLIYRHSDGSVVVDRLCSSRDGNPSPAQLSGVIRAGDVMLYVNEVKLAALDLFNLTELLKDLDKIAERGQLNLVFRCGGKDVQPLHLKEVDSAEGTEVCVSGIVDPPAAASVIPDAMPAYVMPQQNKDQELPSHYVGLIAPLHVRQYHLYPVAARVSLVGGLQHHCKELFLKELSEQVLESRPMHLLQRFQGFFREATAAYSPLLSPASNETSSFYSTAVHREAQPTPFGIHTYVVMAGVGGFNGSLLRAIGQRELLINLPEGVAASRFYVLQVTMAAMRCGFYRGKELSPDHHLVSREASGVPILLSRLNAKSLLQLVTMQAANWCRKLGCIPQIDVSGDASTSEPFVIPATPPLLLTYQIYYSLVAMQNMVFQSSSKVTDLLELWQSTFEAGSSCYEHADPFMRVVSDLLTMYFCLVVSRDHLRGLGLGALSRRRRPVLSRDYRCSMNYFDMDIVYIHSSAPGGSLPSGDSISTTVMVPGKEAEEEAAIRYVRKYRALLNLDFVWALCGAKGYVSAGREVLLMSASWPASHSLRGCLEMCVGRDSVRLDCLMESLQAIAEKSQVVLCTLMLQMGSILDSNRQLGVQLLLHLFPYVGPQAARIEIFRSCGPRGTCPIVAEGGDGAYLNALEAFHEYASGLLRNRAVVKDTATGSDVSLQLLWVEASLLLGNYHRQHLHQSISMGHFQRVLDLLLCSPVSALQHCSAVSTAQLCLQHGFFEGVAAVTGRWLEAALFPGGLQEPAECDVVSRFEHAIITIHVLTRKNYHYYCSSIDAVAHYRPFQSQVRAMLESVQRCISHLLSKLVSDLEAGSAKSYARQHAVDPEMQQLVQLFRLCWKVSIVSAACSMDGSDSCGGSRELGVLMEIALEAIMLANTSSIRQGDIHVLPPSIVRRAFDSIRLSAATIFRAYVVRELLVLGHCHRDSEAGAGTVCIATVVVELLGRSVGVESMLDVIESEPALSRCLNYSMIERLRF